MGIDLNGVVETFNATKEIASGIGKIMAVIFDVLGFIGLRVFLLLFITALFLLFVNMVSPLSKKTNYFMGIFVGVLVAIKANLAFQPFILKYLLIVLLPFVISYLFLYLVKFSKFFVKKCILLLKKGIHICTERKKAERLVFLSNLEEKREKNKKRTSQVNSSYRKIHLSPYSGTSRFYKSIKF
ncbi:hypothetical protein ACFL0U_00615 [Pseudomonadota bacterium]